MGWDLARVWLAGYYAKPRHVVSCPVYIDVHVPGKLLRVVCSAVLIAVLFAVLCSALLL